ncbi:Uu.00g144530.m01.CDS01 [Anthostomella pinea]|uniref:Uu.00g144530.m01.CDS01 n=1 Tax=Anthostomella pinea TaxID=933095 RepID=A0AAI8VQW0_9PEZI|nr:Uu.00g144530.m01.CDS01 [Anthostomella pinea]
MRFSLLLAVATALAAAQAAAVAPDSGQGSDLHYRSDSESDVEEACARSLDSRSEAEGPSGKVQKRDPWEVKGTVREVEEEGYKGFFATYIKCVANNCAGHQCYCEHGWNSDPKAGDDCKLTDKGCKY